jgi:transposase
MKRFKDYSPDQQLLLPPDLNDWLEEGHLAYFIRDVVGELDLSQIYDDYHSPRGGQPAYQPQMMVSLLLYGYCVGMPSSRKIEKATYEQVPFRVLAANQHPDHDTICTFRRRHLGALAQLFVQVLQLCQQAGLVKLGHVALDGTKVQANASKHKAMSYGRMKQEIAQLEGEVEQLLAKAEAIDTEEDALYGAGNRGEELPEELRFRQQRLARIRQAKAALEAQAGQEQLEEDAGGDNTPEATDQPAPEPDESAQRNFTDPDSRIMRDNSTKSFQQSYNCQAAVDDQAQVIVAADVAQQSNDKAQVEPMAEQVQKNTGKLPAEVSADAGYFSQHNVGYLTAAGIDPYVATGQRKHSDKSAPAPRGRIPQGTTVRQRMARKLRTKKGRAAYAKRKQTVEPVFGQIKEARGFRRFLLRGLEPVRAEWRLICLGHNLLKLFRSRTVVTAT